MRIAAPLLFTGLLAVGVLALPAAAQGELVRLPKIQLRSMLAGGSPLADLASTGSGATSSLVVPPRYGFVREEGQAFWLATGASSLVALGSHVLVGLPALVIGASAVSQPGQTSPATSVPLLLGMASVYIVGESALAALAGTLAFNGVGKIYQGHFAAAFAAHVAGALLAGAVSAVTFGAGAMLLGGMGSLSAFTGGAGLPAIQVFSLLGALPAVIIGGIALIAVPALLGAWAMSVSATAKAGYAIDPHWRDQTPVRGAAAPLLTIPFH